MSPNARVRRIGFARLDVDTALPDLVRWLADPDVRPWYDEGEPTAENLSRRFAKDTSVRPYSIVIDEQPVGYIQVYRLGDHPEYQRQVAIDPDAVAIDLFIGEPDYRNRGWGSEVLLACLDQLVFGDMDTSLAMIAPDPANLRAIRCYEKAGFQAIKTVHVVDEDHPGNTGDELVMLLSRDEHSGFAAEG